MKRILLTFLVIMTLAVWLVPDVLAQRGRGGGGGGGQRGFGTGYGGTMRTGYGSSYGTGYGGGFGTGYGSRPGTGYGAGFNTGYGGTPRTGYGSTPRTGYGNRADFGYGLGQAGTGAAWGAAGSNMTGRAGYPGTIRTGSIGTYHRTSDDLLGQGNAIRGQYRNFDAFRPDWYNRYPRAWYPAAWGVGAAWLYPSWATLAAFTSYPDTLTYYDYGTSVVYQGNQVYINGDSVGTQEDYAHHASLIAEAGRTAPASRNDEWLSLGVFSVVGGEEQKSDTTFQLAINKKGVIRGTALNTASNTAQTIYGSVGTKSERAAWTVGDDKTPVYEAGIANLTKNETTMLVHFSKGDTRQYTLVRMEQADGK